MARKARGGRKRFQNGVQKYKIRIKSLAQDSNGPKYSKNHTVLGRRLSLISPLASKCFRLVCWHCFTLCLVPITTNTGSMNLDDDDDNKLVRSTGFRRACHYIVVIVFVLDQSFKFILCINEVMNQQLNNVDTIFCLIVVAGIIFISAISAGTLMRPQETIDLINSWSNVLGHLQDCTGEEYSAFGEPSNAFKIIACTLAPFFIVTVYTIGAILLPSFRLPFLYNVLFENHISNGLVPSVWLRIIFSPLEFVAWLLPILTTILAAIVLQTSISVLRTQIEASRNIPVNNLSDRRVVERLHMCTEVYNRILNPWYKFVAPQGLLGAGALIIVALYVSIRHTELPILLYLLFPYLAIIVGAVLFSMCWDGIIVVRASEDLVNSLRSSTPAYITRLAPSDRAYSMKRAKGIRPNFFQIGIFCDFSFDVTIAVAEEILNQLLFLLSL